MEQLGYDARLPALQDDLKSGDQRRNRYSTQAVGGVIPASSVYISFNAVCLLLQGCRYPMEQHQVREYVAPQPRAQTYTVFHQAAAVTESGKPR